MGWMNGIWIQIRVFSFLHSVQTGSGAQAASCTMCTVSLSTGVKRARREANHSLPSSAEIKNGGAIPPLSPISSWHSFFISFGYLSRKYGYIIYSSCLTCFGSFSHHQVFDLFTFPCIRLLRFPALVSICILQYWFLGDTQRCYILKVVFTFKIKY
jgi:hypothetical protein